ARGPGIIHDSGTLQPSPLSRIAGSASSAASQIPLERQLAADVSSAHLRGADEAGSVRRRVLSMKYRSVSRSTVGALGVAALCLTLPLPRPATAIAQQSAPSGSS